MLHPNILKSKLLAGSNGIGNGLAAVLLGNLERNCGIKAEVLGFWEKTLLVRFIAPEFQLVTMAHREYMCKKALWKFANTIPLMYNVVMEVYTPDEVLRMEAPLRFG